MLDDQMNRLPNEGNARIINHDSPVPAEVLPGSCLNLFLNERQKLEDWKNPPAGTGPSLNSYNPLKIMATAWVLLEKMLPESPEAFDAILKLLKDSKNQPSDVTFYKIREYGEFMGMVSDTGYIVHPLVQRIFETAEHNNCLLYTSPSPRDATLSRMPSSA